MAFSVKPGRGPSLMGAIVGVVAVLFGFFWIIAAASSGAPGIFVLFGVIFIFIAIAGIIYNLYNTAARNRISTFDVTTEGEGSDPIADALRHSSRSSEGEKKQNDKPRKIQGDFCPYCGAKAQQDFDYCPQCGKDI